MDHTAKRLLCGVKGPYLPNGQRVGSYSMEDGRRVWTRHVSHDRHLVRIRNGWSINAPVLDQLLADSVEIVRYVCGEQTYEIELTEFLTSSEILKGFALGEDAHILQRSRWRMASNTSAEFLPLFVVSNE